MKTSRQVRKILLIRTDRLGDVILTLPMVQVLKKNFPTADISMLVNSYTSEILDENALIDEILLDDDAGARLIPFFSQLRSMRARKFDAAVVVHPILRLALLVFLAGIPTRVGTGYRWYSFLFNRRVYEHRKYAEKHEVEYNLNLLSALGCRWDGSPDFGLQVSGASAERVTKLLDKLAITDEDFLLLIHPGSGSSARDWSPKNFGKFAKRCVDELDAKVLLTGRENEEEIIHETLQQIPRGAVSLVNKLDLRDLVAMIRRADLFVSNSTGPLHIAAALGTPVIGIYPPIRECSPTRWGPYTTKRRVFVPDVNLCPRCQGRECEASDCMDQITVDQVFAAACDLKMANEGEGNRLVHAGRSAV